MSRILLLAEAREDALEAFRWYEKECRGLGKIFRAFLHQTIERIRRAPLASPVVYRDLRRALIDRFPYGVFYRVQVGTIIVVGIIHGRRDPIAWQRRA
jgi:plasmid stabilization system protein ParE